jgi:hypothetical protein
LWKAFPGSTFDPLIIAQNRYIPTVDFGIRGLRWKDDCFPYASQNERNRVMKLTVKTTTALQLPHGKTDHIEFDDDITGFGIRLRAGGSRTWVYQYRIGSKQRRMVLGSAKSVPLALARANASTLEAKVKLGGDPAMDKDQARQEAEDTFGVLAVRFLDSRGRECARELMTGYKGT